MAPGATLVVCRGPDDGASSGAASEAGDEEADEEQAATPDGAAAGATLGGRCICRGEMCVWRSACVAAECYANPDFLLHTRAARYCSQVHSILESMAAPSDIPFRGIAGRPRTPGPLERSLSQRGGAGGLARSSVPAPQLGRASQGPASLARRTMGAKAAGQAGSPGPHPRPSLNLARRSSVAGLRRTSVSTRPLALDSGDVAAEILPPSSPGKAQCKQTTHLGVRS